MMGPGVGKSGSPTPRLMISTPRAIAFCFISSIAANRYGGRLLIRPAGSMGNPAIRAPFGWILRPRTVRAEGVGYDRPPGSINAGASPPLALGRRLGYNGR